MARRIAGVGFVTVSLRRSIRDMGREYTARAARASRAAGDAAGDKAGRLWYAPPSPQLDPWCSGPTCQPVTLEIAGSNPVGSANNRFSLRPVRPPGRGVLHPSSRLAVAMSTSGKIGPVNMRPLMAALAVFVAAVVVTALLVIAAPLRPAGTGGVPGATVGAPASAGLGAVASLGASASPAASSASPAATATASPSPTPVRVAIVPVTHFRAAQTATSIGEVQKVLAGTSGRYDALELVSSEADAILAELGLARPTVASRLILASDATKAGRRPRDLAKAACVPACGCRPSVRPRPGVGR